MCCLFLYFLAQADKPIGGRHPYGKNKVKESDEKAILLQLIVKI